MLSQPRVPSQHWHLGRLLDLGFLFGSLLFFARTIYIRVWHFCVTPSITRSTPAPLTFMSRIILLSNIAFRICLEVFIDGLLIFICGATCTTHRFLIGGGK